MTEAQIKVHIGAEAGGGKADIAVGELGAFLTAVNRIVNEVLWQAFRAAIPDVPRLYGRDALRGEPAVVTLPIARLERGSVWLQASVDALATIGLDPETAKNLLLNLIAAGLWDGMKAAYAKRQLAAAARRVQQSARGKSYAVTLEVEGAILQIDVSVSAEGRVSAQQRGQPGPPAANQRRTPSPRRETRRPKRKKK